jgi:catechol 2,3-dioxygenase-like lactoylglutathione lyase family enzyme
MLITPDPALDLTAAGAPASRHLAFGMDRVTFDATFERIRKSGISFGDGPSRPDSMRGPGRSIGVHGLTDSVYFHDPSGHLLEILTYEPAPRRLS